MTVLTDNFLKNAKQLLHMDFETKCGDYEDYPIIGHSLNKNDIRCFFELFKKYGLFYYGQCPEKAYLTGIALKVRYKKVYISYGSMILTCIEKDHGLSQYGFCYNPPFESHYWVTLEGGEIIDLTLPSIVDMAQKNEFLTRFPKFYLAGKFDNKMIVYTEHGRKEINGFNEIL